MLSPIMRANLDESATLKEMPLHKRKMLLFFPFLRNLTLIPLRVIQLIFVSRFDKFVHHLLFPFFLY